MKKANGKPKRATLAEIKEMIRRGDIKTPPADAPTYDATPGFWENAEPFVAPQKTSVHLRVDGDVLEWFRSQGPGHLTRMNAVLRSYYQAKRYKPKPIRKKA